MDDFLAAAPGRWDMLYGPGAARTGPFTDEVLKLRFRAIENTPTPTAATPDRAPTNGRSPPTRTRPPAPASSSLATDVIYAGIRPLADGV